MTEAQAHQFVARWRRVLVLWKARTEAEAIRDLRWSFFGGMIVSVCMFAGVAPEIGKSEFALVLALIGILMFGVSLLFLLHLRQVCRSLDQSQIVNRKS